MAWTWIILALATLAIVLYTKKTTHRKKLPPGPKGLPIFGSLHLLGKSPHRSLHKLAQKYGPIMHIRLGLIPTIVASSPEAAELFLKTHDLTFASRPFHEASKHMSYDQKNLTFGAYGPYWRNMRKMCTLELLSTIKINSFRATRKQELDLCVESLKKDSGDRVPVDISSRILMLNTDISCRMIFGKKYSDKEFNERGFIAVFQEAIDLSGAPNLGNYIPLLGFFDLQGFSKRMKAISKVFDGFLEKIIDEHVRSKGEKKTKDFVDVMLEFVDSEESEYKIGRDNIKAVILDMLGAAMDTSARTVEWALSELIKHPQAMSKLQRELQEKVGLDRVVEESDLASLDYLTMVVKETFRLHPVVPLLIPHEAMEECNVDGFIIPKKSQVLINVWAIGRDPKFWTDPERFFPERFAGSDVDVVGRDFQLLPFGSGRRGCPGMQLGLTMVRFVLAQLVHCFDLELSDGKQPSELDMEEEFGIVVRRVSPLVVIPRYRLSV